MAESHWGSKVAGGGATETSTAFLDLPSDVLHEILQLCEAYDVHALRSTCSLFRQLLDSSRCTLRLCSAGQRPRRLTDLHSLLRHMPLLRSLHCTPLESVRFLAACPNLTSLTIQGPSHVADGGLRLITSTCAHLTALDLSRSCISDLRPLGALTALQSLKLSGCVHVTTLCRLALCSTLTDLDLSHMHPSAPGTRSTAPRLLTRASTADVAPLAITALGMLTALRSINLCGSDTRTVTALAPCRSLTSLSLERCYDLQDIRPLSACTALQSLDLQCTGGVTSLQPLLACTALTFLRVHTNTLKAGELAALQSVCRPGLSVVEADPWPWSPYDEDYDDYDVFLFGLWL